MMNAIQLHFSATITHYLSNHNRKTTACPQTSAKKCSLFPFLFINSRFVSGIVVKWCCLYGTVLYADRYEQAKSKYDELTAARDERIAKRDTIKRFLTELKKRNEILTEFDNCLWLTVIDRVTVQRDGSLIFRFYNGTEISG